MMSLVTETETCCCECRTSCTKCRAIVHNTETSCTNHAYRSHALQTTGMRMRLCPRSMKIKITLVSGSQTTNYIPSHVFFTYIKCMSKSIVNESWGFSCCHGKLRSKLRSSWLDAECYQTSHFYSKTHRNSCHSLMVQP